MKNISEEFPSDYPPDHPFSRPRTTPGPRPDYGPGSDDPEGIPIDPRYPNLPDFDPTPIFGDPNQLYPYYPLGKNGPVIMVPYWLHPDYNPLVPRLPFEIPTEIDDDDNPLGLPFDIPLPSVPPEFWNPSNPEVQPNPLDNPYLPKSTPADAPPDSPSYEPPLDEPSEPSGPFGMEGELARRAARTMTFHNRNGTMRGKQ